MGLWVDGCFALLLVASVVFVVCVWVVGLAWVAVVCLFAFGWFGCCGVYCLFDCGFNSVV